MSEQRITNLEHNYIKMQNTQDQILREIQDLKKTQITRVDLDLAINKNYQETCNDIITIADKKYAGKVVEKVVYLFTGAGGLWIINSLLELI